MSLYRGFFQRVSTNNTISGTLSNGATTTTTSFDSEIATPDMYFILTSTRNLTVLVDLSIDGGATFTTTTYKHYLNKVNTPHKIVKGNRSVRIRLTNNSGASSTYSLQTLFGSYLSSVSPIHTKLSQDSDSTSVRPSDYTLEVAADFREGVSHFGRTGYRTITSANADQQIWSSSQATWSVPGGTASASVSSSSLSDTGLGSGARTLQIKGLDGSGLRVSETITLSGLTPVLTSQTFSYINSAEVLSAGSGQTNAGNISLSILGSLQAYIAAGDSITHQLIHAIPSDANSYIQSFNFECLRPSGLNPTLMMKGWILQNNVRKVIISKPMDTQVDTENETEYLNPILLPAGSLFYVTANSTATGAFIRCRVEQTLIDIY